MDNYCLLPGMLPAHNVIASDLALAVVLPLACLCPVLVTIWFLQFSRLLGKAPLQQVHSTSQFTLQLALLSPLFYCSLYTELKPLSYSQ
jgi:hypothetical protein